jgi:hypothetical protein
MNTPAAFTLRSQVVSCLLLAFLSWSVGCYSTEEVSKEDFKALGGQVDVIVFTTDSLSYEFSRGNYRTQGDTVSGYGIRRRNGSAEVLPALTVRLSDGDVIETRAFDLLRTAMLCGGIGLGCLILYAVLFDHPQEPTMVVSYGVMAPVASP